MSKNIISNLTKRVAAILKEDVIKGKPAIARSPKWDSVRKRHLKNNPDCAACGSTKNVQVHHIRPFHLFPQLELEPSNFITLCETDMDGKNNVNENHHLHLGHNGNFHNNNDKVLNDVDNFRLTQSKLGKLEGYDMTNLKKILNG